MSEISINTLKTMLANLDDAKKYQSLRDVMETLPAPDLAAVFEDLPAEKLPVLFRLCPKDLAADVFTELTPATQQELIDGLTDTELKAVVDELCVDDATDLVEEMPANVVMRILRQADPDMRKMINEILNYPEDSAGSIMTIEMVQLHTNFTASQAIEQIRKTGVDKETVYTCYCTDRERHLLGSVPLLSLLLCDENALVGDIMEDDAQLISVNTLDDQEVVAEVVKKYDLLSVPVVDNENRLVGIITVDDVVDVIEEETTEDFEKMALIAPSDDDYLKTGVFKQTRNRIIWLLILMVSGTFTGKIIEGYEALLAGFTTLTAAIPMLMDTGGNAGNQVSTLIIRGLAVGKLEPRDYFKIVFKELRVAVLCGTALGAVNILRMYLFCDGTLQMFFVVSLAMFCAVIVAKLIGCTLPILAKLIKLDPALMAGPMITTIVDIITLIIYFSLANLLLIH